MRNNRILGAAVAAALSLPLGVAYAGGSFVNVGDALSDIAAAEGGGSVVSSSGASLVAIDSTFEGASQALDIDEDGIVYATELFNHSAGSPNLPCQTDNLAAVMYTVGTATISTPMVVRFELPGGETFVEDPILGISDDAGTHTTVIARTSGGSGVSNINFNIDSGDLANADQLMLFYRIQGASALATEDGTVTMTASIKDDTGNILDTTRTVTIATSKRVVSAGLKAQTSGLVKIDVETENMEFATGSACETSACQSSTEAEIGSITITDLSATGTETVMECDGTTEFAFSSASDGDTAVGDGNQLVISGGQFDASTGTDMVYIDVDGSGDANDPDSIAVVDGGTATFTLDDDQMLALFDGDEHGIRMKVSGDTEINTIDSAPTATLTIDFAQGNDAADTYGVQDLTVAATDLLQIKKNGTQCTVFNVHKGDAATKTANGYTANDAGKYPVTSYGSYIRVINTSSKDGSLTGVLTYVDSSNTKVTTAALSLLDDPLPAGQTAVFDSWKIQDKMGVDTWKGRAMLEITSTLSKLEVMALLRRTPTAPLTNVSLGATGDGCSN